MQNAQNSLQYIQTWLPDFEIIPRQRRIPSCKEDDTATKTEAIVCKISFDEEENAKRQAWADAKLKAALHVLVSRRQREHSKQAEEEAKSAAPKAPSKGGEEGQINVKNSPPTPNLDFFTEGDVVLDYTGDWDLFEEDSQENI